MMKSNERIFLGGGGNETDAEPLDNKFVHAVNELGLLGIAYIPVAKKPERFESSFQWFEPQFKDKVQKIEMWTDLSSIKIEDLHRMGAVYIGGGDTIRLMKYLTDTGFIHTLKQFVSEKGIIYGGSAGAIILGKDLRTAPESTNYDLDDYMGLNLLSGYSVACHYRIDEKSHYQNLSKQINGPILAISEKSGLVISEGEAIVVGNGEVSLFTNEGFTQISNNEILKL